MYEGKGYRTCTVSISDGVRNYSYVAYDRDGPFPEVRLFERCEVVVGSAKTEKGNISLTGEIKQAG
ncbi:hypothetical protein MLD52_12685 [Puniceicoccaceae bacterium K14]|nr:hypothetical protein [Puniceicoccaceae bacterium K14]